MREVVRAIHVYLGIRFGQEDLALRGGHSQFRSPEVGTLAQRFGLQVFHIRLERLVRQIANHVIIGRHRVVAQKLTQTNQRLHLRQTGGGHVGLKLQQLQLDLEIVAFADVVPP